MSTLINYKLTLLEEQLGTTSMNPEILHDYQQAKLRDAAKKGQKQTIVGNQVVNIDPGDVKALQDEELEAISKTEMEEKGITGFPRMTVGDDNDVPFIYDYLLKGFFKDAARMLHKVSGTATSKAKAYVKAVDGLVFITETNTTRSLRKIPFLDDDGNPVHVDHLCQRPLRAQTPQGERVALASSEVVSAGATLSFGVLVLSDEYKDMIMECMNYGQLRGLGQWRNSGKGRFQAEVVGKPIHIKGIGEM